MPPTVKGRFRGQPRLAVDNLGNTKVTASVAGSDHGDHLSYEVRRGMCRSSRVVRRSWRRALKPKQIIWFGAKEERPYTLAVRRSGVDPTEIEGDVRPARVPAALAGDVLRDLFSRWRSRS